MTPDVDECIAMAPEVLQPEARNRMSFTGSVIPPALNRKWTAPWTLHRKCSTGSVQPEGILELDGAGRSGFLVGDQEVIVPFPLPLDTGWTLLVTCSAGKSRKLQDSSGCTGHVVRCYQSRGSDDTLCWPSGRIWCSTWSPRHVTLLSWPHRRVARATEKITDYGSCRKRGKVSGSSLEVSRDPALREPSGPLQLLGVGVSGSSEAQGPGCTGMFVTCGAGQF